MDAQLLLLIGIGTMVVIIFAALAFGGDSYVEKRLSRVAAGTVPTTTKADKKDKPEDKLSAIRQQSGGGALNQWLARILPNREKLRAAIARSGREITLTQYGIWVVISFIFTLIIAKFAGSLSWPVALFAGIAVAAWLPYRVIRGMGNKRIKEFLGGFPEAIDTMVRGLKSGLPVTESINAVGREAAGPVGEEFRRMADGIRLGRSMDEAMWEVGKRIDVPEFRFLIISMAIQRETGGNLAETLAGLAELLRRRRQLKHKIRAMSSEARASAMIIGSLPFVMWSLMLLVNKDYALTLFREESGHMAVLIGGTWMFMGIMVMKKMIDFEI